MGRSVVVDMLLSGLIDASGNPLSGGKVYTYAAGTTTDKTCWTDHLKQTPAANPVELDSLGQAQIYADGSYKFVIHTSADVLFDTIDNIFFSGFDGSAIDCGTSSGAANVFTVTPSPATTEYTNGQLYTFTAHQTNTAACVFQLGALATKAFAHPLSASIPLIGGEIVIGQSYLCRYDGTVVRVLSPMSNCIHKVTATSTAGVSSTAENTLFTYTIPANVLAPYKALRLTLFGDIKNTTGGAVTFFWRVKLGGTSFFTVGAISVATGVDRGTFKLECFIESFGASAQKTSGHLHLNDATSNAVAGTAQDLPYTAQSDSLAQDTTTALALIMTGQMDTSSANAEMRVKSGTVEVL